MSTIDSLTDRIIESHNNYYVNFPYFSPTFTYILSRKQIIFKAPPMGTFQVTLGFIGHPLHREFCFFLNKLFSFSSTFLIADSTEYIGLKFLSTLASNAHIFLIFPFLDAIGYLADNLLISDSISILFFSFSNWSKLVGALSVMARLFFF